MKNISDTELSRSKVIKKRGFPTREDYEHYFGGSTIWSNEQEVQQIHKHWHGRGQNGCVFAQHLAKESEYSTGWHSNVFIDDTYDQLKLDKTIEQAIENPKIEVLSLLYPNVVTVEQLSALVKSWITNSKIISLESATSFKDRICLSLRIELGKSGISSWLMMFAPFTFFPNTRQSPITELAIRVKPKPDHIYPKLSQDRKKAHLADTPFFLPETIVDSTWEATFRNTEYLLGYKPDFIAAAKTTISFEMGTWESFFGELDIKIQDFENEELQYS
jgi:hypothetical protein